MASKYDRERWRAVIGYDGKYYVSDHGRVKNRKRLLKPQFNKRFRYWQIMLYDNDGKNKMWSVARLVALHFIDQPVTDRKMYVVHIGDTLDNYYKNLTWEER